MNVASELELLCRTRGWTERPAYYSNGKVYTHGWIHEKAARVATLLASHGATKGTKILIAVPDTVEWVLAFLASARLGCLAITINPDLTQADHNYLANDCEPELIIARKRLHTRFRRRASIDSDHLLPATEHLLAAPVKSMAANTPLYVQYTSGTTGAPKGSIHKHEDIGAYHTAVGEAMLGLNIVDRALSSSKLYFPYGFGNSFVYPLKSGSSAILREPWLDLSSLTDVLAQYRPSILYSVPSTYSRMLAQAPQVDFSSTRVLVSAGEPLSLNLAQALTKRSGVPVLDELGSTELGGAYCANRLSDNYLGTIGTPLPGYEVALRTSEGEPAPERNGQIRGELWVRGPTLMLGYVGRHSNDCRPNEWYATADLATLRADGRYVHNGRLDDLEIVAGINVSPLELENVLNEHDAVREVVFATVPDGHGARQLTAFVIMASQTRRAEEVCEELLGFARHRLAPHKVPRAIVFVDSIPRTPTGKIKRHLVRRGYW